VVEFGNELPGLVLIKSDGATTYFLRDLATIKYRLKKWKPDIIAYEVGVDQSLYFRQLFKTVSMIGWQEARFIHIIHGLMRGKEGKFSTRQGQTIHLREVLSEAIAKSQEIIVNSSIVSGLSIKEQADLAKQIGIGAVKYNDLSQHHAKDIIFDWQKVLNLKGNSGPYLQYTFARTQSVLQKSKQGHFSFKAIEFSDLEKIEVLLLKKISHFPIIIEKAGESFSPNLLCNYVFDLSQKFNLFYEQCPILQASLVEQKNFRLALTFAVGQVIKNNLNLLGIESPNKM
jgi:arginyl-tRNA synthetase